MEALKDTNVRADLAMPIYHISLSVWFCSSHETDL